MCARSDAGPGPYGIRVYEGRWSDAYLGRHPIRPGYVYVVWKGRHVVEPTELSPEETAGFWGEVARVRGRGRGAVPAGQDELVAPGERGAASPRAPRPAPA